MMSQLNTTIHGYPMQLPVADAMRKMTGGIPGGELQVWARPGRLYHAQDLINTGTAELQYFNVAKQLHVTNMQQARNIPTNSGFALRTVRVSFIPGINIAGARTGAAFGDSATSFGAVSAAATDVIDAQWKWAEYIRELMSTGLLTLTVNDRPVLDQIKGLDSFPAAKGLSISGSAAASATTATGGSTDVLASISNGVPAVGNSFTFETPYPIVAGQSLGVTLQWPGQGVDFTDTNGPLNGATAGAAAGQLIVELGGVLVSPASD